VLHNLRDRLPIKLSAHLSAELPLLVRGVYYDQFEAADQPADWDREAFCAEVSRRLSNIRPVDPQDAVQTVFALLSRHVSRGQIEKVKHALPAELQAFWQSAEERVVAPPAARRRTA